MANDISDEDKALFRRTVAGIELSPCKSESKPETLYLSDYYSETVQAETVLSYCAHAIPAKRFDALKRGEIVWQAKLDLHGLKVEPAREALIQFIMKQSKLAHRCLLIVHGKGAQRREAPILKNLVNHWLRQFPSVLAFHSAIPRHGGTGVLYVLLKKQLPALTPTLSHE